eukprot:3917079-Prymnesium_polylepis.1
MLQSARRAAAPPPSCPTARPRQSPEERPSPGTAACRGAAHACWHCSSRSRPSRRLSTWRRGPRYRLVAVASAAR